MFKLTTTQTGGYGDPTIETVEVYATAADLAKALDQAGLPAAERRLAKEGKPGMYRFQNFMHEWVEIEADDVTFVCEYSILTTPAGPRCGSCSERGYPRRHANVASIRACHQARRDAEADTRAIQWAEGALDRWHENAAFDDARAQDAYEAAHGVVPFDVAMRQAELANAR